MAYSGKTKKTVKIRNIIMNRPAGEDGYKGKVSTKPQDVGLQPIKKFKMTGKLKK